MFSNINKPKYVLLVLSSFDLKNAFVPLKSFTIEAMTKAYTANPLRSAQCTKMLGRYALPKIFSLRPSFTLSSTLPFGVIGTSRALDIESSHCCISWIREYRFIIKSIESLPLEDKDAGCSIAATDAEDAKESTEALISSQNSGALGFQGICRPLQNLDDFTRFIA